jgi:outer membrane receptor protein involved in Fe transport
MNKFYKKLTLPFLLMLASSGFLWAQTTISGSVKDADTKETMPGVNIVVKGSIAGTITDTQGNFKLSVNQAPPLILAVSFIGYSTQEIEVKDANTTIEIALAPSTSMLSDVNVTAGRVEQNLLQSPITIEKMGVLEIKQGAAPDFYDGLANMKGVQVMNGSLNFTAVNTRGFATISNTRFVQLMDGMDTQAPLLNFPTGSIMTVGELDAESIEVVPGAASALYGPNAFNGIMIMKSKNPFEYQGLSAQVKQGITSSNAGGSNPYGMYSIRYATAFNNKFAFKVNASYMKATDWTANDYRTDRNSPESKTDLSGSQNFDGLNLYGDETPIPTGVPSIGENGVIRRTGLKENTLLDNRDATTLKLDGALHYRLNDKMELSYTYRYGGGSSLYQGQSKYALRDFNQQFHKIELKGDNFFIRGYLSATDAGKSYNMDALGGLVNEAFNPTVRADGSGWAQEYVLASQGYFSGLGFPGGNPGAARAFADRNMINPSTGQFVPAFQDTVNAVRKRLFQATPAGAGFYDNSKLWHGEVYYNFKQIKWAEIIAGGNVRRYSLFTKATVFDEAPVDRNNPQRIFIDQYGVYTQISKTIANKLKLTGSIRYDKMQDFDGHFTPRFSAVYNINTNHVLRGSFQTGFRLPDTQAQYIYFANASGILLGGTPTNAGRYGLYNGGGGAYYYDSFKKFSDGGGTLNPDGSVASAGTSGVTPQTANLPYVKPEQLWSYELGYRGIIDKLTIDLNYYYTSYNDFLGEVYVVNKVATSHQGKAIPQGSTWYPYVNSPYTLTSQGAGLGLSYIFPRDFTLSGNYNYASFSGQQSPDFQAGFNTPQNMYSFALGNRKLTKNLGFNVNFRYQDSFLWQSSYSNYNYTVNAYGVLDAQVSYKVPSIKSMIKIGGTNLGGNDYRTNLGSPFIGQMYYISITFDEFLK